MKSDYADNWDALPPALQDALTPIVTQFDAAADLLFDRRLNLSFEYAVKELSIPGIALLTDALRGFAMFVETRLTIQDAAQGALLFDDSVPITAYDLPIYMPCLYLSQLAQSMQEQNVRVWKCATAGELVSSLLVMARLIRPDIEIARVCIAALHDMAQLYPDAGLQLAQTAAQNALLPNAANITELALRLMHQQ